VPKEDPVTDPITRGLGIAPRTIFAVHLNYRGRAAQRGRIPGNASYFLKPVSSLAAGDGEVVRPDGTELLAFEGEIALVIGRPRVGSIRPTAGRTSAG
jgi:5-oxopent-3-ene-1,2,5-tricarboxylate decarboxylase/2-hydroxyhepta-2,4-diene-1,7-dioate isomerase